jgi:hypothetical protein
LTLLYLSVPVAAGAATLENSDLEAYSYRIVLPHTSRDGKIYDQSMLFGVCEYGCEIQILETGETMHVKPNDHIVIEDGVMKHKD